MIVLSYLWLLALIPLLVEKDDREIQWHAKHGIVLMVVELIIWVTLNLITIPLGMFLGCLLALLFPILFIVEVVLHIMCIVKGINGQRLIIPGISEFANKF
ncbi:MAG: hypothetical protein IT178_03890 [Acidobacteria bacterium]|nr:hypothetical protein [Acidobacteriota bacterium]